LRASYYTFQLPDRSTGRLKHGAPSERASGKAGAWHGDERPTRQPGDEEG